MTAKEFVFKDGLVPQEGINEKDLAKCLQIMLNQFALIKCQEMLDDWKKNITENQDYLYPNSLI